ncbi:MAG: T9SS type A sorting domain-containing protein [FCB group bacterium]|nr:T9SS type A sorting domain-containing protein [FCB group bacterium]
MRKTLTTFILSAICFVLVSAAWAVDFAGSINVGTVSVGPGEQVALPVTLSGNNIDIMALRMPLRFSSPYLTVDSVSFSGSLKPTLMNGLVSIDNLGGMVSFTYSPAGGEPTISASEGLLATIYFSAGSTAPDQAVVLDSVCRQDHGQTPFLWTRLEVADNSGAVVYLPGFSSGTIEIQTPMDADNNGLGLPGQFELRQNYPNPFNPSTTIDFSLPERAHVQLKIYNILGQEIETLIDEQMNAGQYNVVWNAEHFASGLYFYRLSHKNQALTKKMTLLK